MKYKTQEFKGLDKEITELTGDKETSGTELNAVQIDCAMISPWDSSSTMLMKTYPCHIYPACVIFMSHIITVVLQYHVCSSF